ncbi:transglutaminase-like domain-containing protein [Pseudobutyrivibrio ruminis]|uniref:transglutaminase-like domain-containing protein n=1 Tax=Pseudobutyrivibrio ruminis TaxID=46206 RepID=UPI00040B3EC5|nr:transglutaminase-like domain-containing protein [Pseudobutyrivibrio ruminis]
MKRKLLLILIPLIIILGAVTGGLFFYFSATDLVYSEVYIEAGSKDCTVGDFLKHDADGVAFSKDSDFDLNTPGDYKITINRKMPVIGKMTYHSTLHVQDTTAPVVTLAEETIEMYTTATAPTAADLVESVIDASNCTIDFKEPYDFTKEGKFNVVILVTDEAGNTTESTIPCTVIEDVTPPEITGVEPLTVSQGDAISYKKGVTVTDDKDENPTLEVDTSLVNPDKRGTYKITYTATDAAGNTSEKTTTIKIVSAKISEATEETVYAKADEILSEIITDNMTQLQQAKAVFDWVVKNITYSETAGIDDLLSAAYKGMYYRVGDCTVKQKTAEVMLNRLGIKNMEIEKIRDTRGHYWLLIDVGEGWYHYDPNLQLDGTLIFYWHDADLWAYSNAHKNTHNYDPSKYPHIQ